jgi:hypothetical protein
MADIGDSMMGIMGMAIGYKVVDNVMNKKTCKKKKKKQKLLDW